MFVSDVQNNDFRYAFKKTLGTGRYFGTLVCAMEQKVQSHNYWLKELQMNRTQADQKNS